MKGPGARGVTPVLRPGDSVTFCSPGVALNGLTTGLPSLRLAPDASRAARPALLVQHHAESEPELFPLLKPHTAVGRGLAADLRLDHAFISARQCSIELRSPASELSADCAMEVTPAPPLAPSTRPRCRRRSSSYSQMA